MEKLSHVINLGGTPNDKQDSCPCWGWGKDARGLQMESRDPREVVLQAGVNVIYTSRECLHSNSDS